MLSKAKPRICPTKGTLGLKTGGSPGPTTTGKKIFLIVVHSKSRIKDVASTTVMAVWIGVSIAASPAAAAAAAAAASWGKEVVLMLWSDGDDDSSLEKAD